MTAQYKRNVHVIVIWHMGPSHLQMLTHFQDTQDVLADIIYWSVALNAGDAQDLHTRHCQSHHDSLSIIHTTVHVHKQFLHAGL